MGSMPLPRPTEAVALAMPIDELGRPSRRGACFPRKAGQPGIKPESARRGTRAGLATDLTAALLWMASVTACQ